MMAAREKLWRPTLIYRVEVYDLDTRKVHQQWDGLRWLGARAQLDEVVDDIDAEHYGVRMIVAGTLQ